MTDIISAFDRAIDELDRLKRVLQKSNQQVQVRTSDERGLAKATALTWFNKHKPQIALSVSQQVLVPLDEGYRIILEGSERASARSRYIGTIKHLRAQLVSLRSDCLALPPPNDPNLDRQPDFSPLIPDKDMQDILAARWIECTLCIKAGAPLAATVMMGGLLEALLLARVNRESNKSVIFTAKAAPKDANRKTRQLKEWMLSDYIQVAHEMKWVSVSAKNVGEVLRDYRNYVHPYKQLSHAVHLSPDDARLFWDVTKNITDQIIRSVP